MLRTPTNHADPAVVGLRALGWTLSDADRAERLLAVTGLDADDLRARAAEPAVLDAVLGFLEAHEPDLLACAEALDLKPEALVRARTELDR